MFNRLFKIPKTRSFFLFGARGTGKSTLLRSAFSESEALWFDLLDLDLENQFSRDPSKLKGLLEREASTSKPRAWVVIDEVQKIPQLLSVVHEFIRARKFKFALTGSSARKLKRGQADLLAGRASWFELYPLTHQELGNRFNLDEVLNWGSLPEIFDLNEIDRGRYLKSYCSIYLKEEIIAEQVIRKIRPFRNFLELVALQNAQIINYSKFARDCGVDTVTIQTYFEILKDTLLGIELPPFHLSIRKRQRTNPKFYFFDTGVTRALAGLIGKPIAPKTFAYGKAFEQLVLLEIHRIMRAKELDWRMSYLVTKDNAEIDLIIDRGPKDRLAIEIKSTDQTDPVEVREFERLARDLPHCQPLYFSCDEKPQRHGTVECVHWQDGIRSIFE